MALLETGKAEFPYNAEELEAIDILRTDGRRFKFRGKDGKEDSINGVFQVKFTKSTGAAFSVYGFEEFRASQHSSPNGMQNTRISQISNNFAKADVRPNSKKVGIAFIPDTRNNRNVLADMYFDKKFVVEGLLTESGPVEGIVIKKDLEMLALKRKSQRQAEANGDTKVVDRMLGNMTPEQREYFTKKFVEIENQKKEKLVAPKIEKEENVSRETSDNIAIDTELNTISTESGNTISFTDLETISAPRPEGSLKYFALKKEAKKVVYDKNALIVEALKKEYGDKWNSSPKYKKGLQVQIDALLGAWNKSVTV